MSEFRGADERLQQAFQALGQHSDGECPEQELEAIWRAVSGELPAPERRELVDRLAANPASADAWRVAREVWEASRERGAPDLESRSRFQIPSWFALAAAIVLIVGIGIGLVFRPSRPRDDVFREQHAVAVESLVPADRALPRDQFRLRWTPGPAGSRYQVRVTTDDLQVLATATELTIPEFIVDRGQLTPVQAGGRVLWQVEAALPSGDNVTSPTFVARVQ